MDADVIIVGAGLAGLVAARELTAKNKTVALVDQENAASLGGQAFWSFGGLFLEGPNFEPANPLSTPEHIAPVWYFTPYYAILRAVPDQRMGALLMGLAVMAFLFMPWLDRSPVKSMRYRGWMSRTALTLFAVSFIALGYLGLQPAEGLYVYLARFFATIYFLFFLLMPWYSRLGTMKPVPERVVFHDNH